MELDFREIASLQTKSTDFQQHAVVLTPNHTARSTLNTSEIVPCIHQENYLGYTIVAKSSSSQF